MFNTLLVDGDPGAKTRGALKTATAQMGPSKVKEGVALGRFKQALDNSPTGGPEQLQAKTSRAFGPLYPQNQAKAEAGRQTLAKQQKAIADYQKKQEAERKEWTSLASSATSSLAMDKPKTTPTPPVAKSTPEGFGLQATINDLGNDFGNDLGKTTDASFKPIKEDGIIGPKTFDAFNTVLPITGTERFTSKMGANLGFFDLFDE